jgi:hypothetical protein
MPFGCYRERRVFPRRGVIGDQTAFYHVLKGRNFLPVGMNPSRMIEVNFVKQQLALIKPRLSQLLPLQYSIDITVEFGISRNTQLTAPSRDFHPKGAIREKMVVPPHVPFKPIQNQRLSRVYLDEVYVSTRIGQQTPELKLEDIIDALRGDQREPFTFVPFPLKAR